MLSFVTLSPPHLVTLSAVSALDLLWLLLAAGVGVVLVWAVRARRQSHGTFLRQVAEAEVCDHLRPVYELLASRGHVPANVGQRHPELPFEIHMAPPFEPRAVYDELKLAEPVFVSERNVLYCKEDLCEIHPTR